MMKKLQRIRAEARFKPRAEASTAHADFERLIDRLRAMSLNEARARFRSKGVPPFLYKYRGVPVRDDAGAVDRLRDVLVRNRLWMANIHTVNDPFDSYVEYRVTLGGAELRRALQKFFRRTTDAVSAKADLLVTSDLVAQPKRVQALMKAAHDQFLDQVGICSLSATARNTLMWAHYADEHRGIAIQFEPAADPAQLLPYKMNYETNHRVVVDTFGGGDGGDAAAQLLGKGIDWAYEQEWRLIERGRAGVIRAFRPRALTGVILGMRISPESEALLDDLLAERAAAGHPAPRLLRVSGRGHAQRLRIVRR